MVTMSQKVLLTTKSKLIAAGIVMLCWLLLFFVLVIRPQMDNLHSLKAQVEQQEASVASLEAYSQEHPDMDRYLNELDNKALLITNLLPDHLDISSFLLLLDQSAQKTGVQLISVKPGKTVSQKGRNETSVELIIHSNYKDMLAFFYELNNLPRFTNLISVSTDLRQQGILETKLNVAIYSLSDTMNSSKPENKPSNNQETTEKK